MLKIEETTSTKAPKMWKDHLVFDIQSPKTPLL